MLTRLRIRGFKNLVDAEIRFGPLTCIAGLNGVGKSNLFDAIRFLSLLADRPFIEAASQVRGGSEDFSKLFTVGGDGKIVFEADLLMASSGHDDFNREAQTNHPYLRYRLELALATDQDHGLPRLRLVSESLDSIPKLEAKKALGFSHERAWLDSLYPASKRRASFIKTEGNHVELSSDKMRDYQKSKRGGGRPTSFHADRLPRTVLSSALNADEARTAVLARAEMRTWRLLQLEPSALRRPDNVFNDPSAIDMKGAHVPATLLRLMNGAPEVVLDTVAGNLFELVDRVKSVRAERDDVRHVIRFIMADHDGVELPAESLSDGTLRFVALAVMEQDPQAAGLLCFEEPENGIHPMRLHTLMDLLHGLASDPTEEADTGDLPLSQILMNSHSPVVLTVLQKLPGSVMFADIVSHVEPGQRRPSRRTRLRQVALDDRARLFDAVEGQLVPSAEVRRYLATVESGA